MATLATTIDKNKNKLVLLLKKCAKSFFKIFVSFKQFIRLYSNVP